MLYDDTKLYTTLAELSVLSDDKLKQAFERSQKSHVPLAELLVNEDLVSDENVGKVVADIYALPFIRLSDINIPDSVLTLIPEQFAKKQKVIVFRKDTQGIHVGTSEPGTQAGDFLQKKFGKPIILHFATDRDIESALALYKKNIAETFDEIIHKSIEEAKKGVEYEPPIIILVDQLISYAYTSRASDIHIEPGSTLSLVRYRIDGILRDIVTVPRDLHERIVTRIKVLSKLKTDEHQSAQDGKMQVAFEQETVDIRVSIVPVTEGEKIVLRILSQRSRAYSLKDLGFSEDDLRKVESAYNKPYGMILATGPTGCGKTTTLYAILKILNRRDINIMTIEDPVEYEIPGINQIQVNPKTNLTFASGLKSIVRQDPNVILVGEIRDEDTADIAINASMTGHLVLTTLHTNDAATAVPRLFDMKVEPYLVASTVTVVIAQRLVRKICVRCRYSQITNVKELLTKLPPAIVKEHFHAKREIRVYVGKGCDVCQGSGYVGRVGIFEILVVNDSLRKAITDRKDSSIIKALAAKSGMKTMYDDGIEKVKQGITTVDEVTRVTKD